MDIKRIICVIALLSPFIFGLAACKEGAHSHSAAAAQRYYCPMHPTYVSDRPGECPICHMRLVPLKKEVVESTGAAQGTVRMDENRQQLIGVKIAIAEKKKLVRTIRASARVARDAELYSAIREYQAVPEGDIATRKALELRLAQMGLSDRLIKDVSAPNFDAAFLLVAAPGKKVWIYADVYGEEASRAKSGDAVELTSAAFPGKTWRATVRSVSPVVERETRTLRLLVETTNDGDLKSDMYLNAQVRLELGLRPVVVPTTAVMDTGVRKLAYVEKAPGEFEPREIKTGAEGDDGIEILSGIIAGEKVVTSANFLIDSESKIKGAVSK